eukprot:5860491-Pyramimonas_sp.AAC.1
MRRCPPSGLGSWGKMVLHMCCGNLPILLAWRMAPLKSSKASSESSATDRGRNRSVPGQVLELKVLAAALMFDGVCGCGASSSPRSRS